MSKWIIFGLVLLGVAGGWWYAQASRIEVDVAKVGRADIDEFIDEQGKTRLPKTYLVTMPYAGRVEAITLTEGTPVKEGQQVAGIVPLDLELALEGAKAAVDRLQAQIVENKDITVEQTGRAQSEQFVKSMREAVKAAVNRVTAGREKVTFAAKQLDRYRGLRDKNAVTQEEYDQKILDDVQSKVDLEQDKLVQASMEAMEIGTALMPIMMQQYIDRKGLTVEVTEKQKQEALARLKQAVEDDRRGRMHSPVNGVVLKRAVSNERYLPAGEVLLEIGRLEDLEVEAEVLSQDVVRVAPGDRVEIYGPAIGRTPVSGTVSKIYPAGFTKVSSLGVEQQRVLVVIKFNPEDLARVREAQKLGVDYRVRVKIITEQKPNALVVPRSALFRAADGTWQVMAVRGGRAVKTDVKTGLKNDSQVEILDGLTEGDLVVRAPETRLTDGARVKHK
jgi:HlyD family secretion protein